MVWSLRDINFEIEQGEAVGIIGRNGAGKSTLLKILSRVTAPTTGRITGNGRVASLLEVGTGFHPELTGKENIYLNGAILGMRKKEIARKFDEIVAFAGVERYIDTPVKRYSSGMYVRLAFAVAAHLESEILIVDEVLAVGDAEFQKKCLGKMGEVSKGEGRTVLFVSHNLQSVKSICTKGMLLSKGSLNLFDTVDNIINQYSRENSDKNIGTIEIFNLNKEAWFIDFSIRNENLETICTFEDCLITIKVESKKDIHNVFIGIGINDMLDVRLFTLFSRFSMTSYKLNPGVNVFTCKVNALPLKPGLYKVEIFVGNDHHTLDYYNHPLVFEVNHPKQYNKLLPDSSQGNFCVEEHWN
jgi:lipopolysaccharide transport system ATP-binding protein